MKRTLLSLLALFFPWIAFLILSRPIAAFVALAIQLTFFGWPIAGIWAWKSVRDVYPALPPKQKPSSTTIVADKTQQDNPCDQHHEQIQKNESTQHIASQQTPLSNEDKQP